MLSWVEHENSFITSGSDMSMDRYLKVFQCPLDQDKKSQIYVLAYNKIGSAE